jgi:enterobacterial common antigen flippase
MHGTSTSRSRALGGTLATNLVILLLGLASGTLTARLLEPTGRGLLAAVIFWPQLIAAVGMLSLNEAVTLRLAKTGDAAEQILPSALLVAAVLSVISVAAGIAPLFSLAPAGEGLHELALLYFLLFVPLNSLALLLLAIDHGQLRFRPYNVFRLLVGATYFLCLMTLWAADRFTVVSCVLANLFAIAFTALFVGIRNRKHLKLKPVSKKEIRALLSSSASIHSHALLLMLSSQADRALVLLLLNPSLAGIYIVAWSLPATVATVLTTTLHSIVFPYTARSSEEKLPKQVLAANSHRLMLASICVMGGLALSMPWLIPLLFGPQYVLAVTPALLLCSAYAVNVIRQGLISTLRGFGALKSAVVSELVGLGLFIAIITTTYDKVGIAQIATALLVANSVALIVLMVDTSRTYGMALADWNGFSRTNILQSMSTLRRLLHSFNS